MEKYWRNDIKQNCRLIQHKIFAITHPNFSFVKTSFMLETLDES